ncbi:hypothetical protein [Halomonas sp. LBP4]|uniref:hypothetical protein n=1 Tax=Halomonas sp. LBP4 TaxID=2044917 RepID=UPI000D7752A7|nr:hypothetical protein [Halomonas sp. LBP4]PXX95774.1 hypothetical protein CR157_16340 [Halomonas sp. LBP4]
MSGTRLILFTDLDDTLFMSHRSLPDTEERKYLGAVDAQGEPLSFQTGHQHRLWSVLSQAADLIIPVTGRTSYALNRVTLLAKGGLAVVSHGALVLHDGQVVPAWQNHIAERIAVARERMAQALHELEDQLAQVAPESGISLRLLEDLGCPVYLSVKTPTELDNDALGVLHDAAERHGLQLHANTRNAALRPSYTCKADACAFLLKEIIKRQPGDTVLTLGDSLSDIRFMDAGNMTLMPTQSQIWTHIKELAQ